MGLAAARLAICEDLDGMPHMSTLESTYASKQGTPKRVNVPFPQTVTEFLLYETSHGNQPGAYQCWVQICYTPFSGDGAPTVVPNLTTHPPLPGTKLTMPLRGQLAGQRHGKRSEAPNPFSNRRCQYVYFLSSTAVLLAKLRPGDQGGQLGPSATWPTWAPGARAVS